MLAWLPTHANLTTHVSHAAISGLKWRQPHWVEVAPTPEASLCVAAKACHYLQVPSLTWPLTMRPALTLLTYTRVSAMLQVTVT